MKHTTAHPICEDTATRQLKSIPEHWHIRRLKFVANIVAGQSPPSEIVTDYDGSFPFLQGNAEFGTTTPAPRFSCQTPNKRAQRGDILLSVRAPVGAINTADQDYGIGRGLCAISPTTHINENFLHYTLQVTKMSLSNVATGSTYDAVTVGQVGDIPTPLPPPSEQAAIVRYLDHADELINRYISAKERLIDLLEEQRQAVIHQAVTRGLDPNAPSKQSSVEWLADVPQHWQLPEIKQVSKILRGKFTHRPRNDPSLYGGIYPFIQTGDVAAANGIVRTHRQTLNQRGLAVSTMFPAGTLVMTIAANIGDVAVLNFEACFPDSIVGFVPTNKVERDFLYYLFRAMKSEFLREAPVNTQGNLNVERIGSKKIPLPSVDEQVTIVRHLAEVSAHIDASMELAHRQVSLVGEYRTRLIADVVTGQIDVHKRCGRTARLAPVKC